MRGHSRDQKAAQWEPSPALPGLPKSSCPQPESTEAPQVPGLDEACVGDTVAQPFLCGQAVAQPWQPGYIRAPEWPRWVPPSEDAALTLSEACFEPAPLCTLSPSHGKLPLLLGVLELWSPAADRVAGKEQAAALAPSMQAPRVP